MKNKLFTRICAVVMSVAILTGGMPAISYAGIVGTSTFVEAGQRAENMAAVKAGLARADVREQMLSLGVNVSQVESRLAGLSDAELQRLANQMNELPAGGDLLVVLGIVLVVLIVLELTGAIDIFKR